MIKRELSFLLTLWKTNLLSAMEYRASFLSQMIGMMLNNAVYFIFWIIFFNRFENINGWELDDMFLMFGVVAGGIGMAVMLFGNTTQLATIISGGRLDYYLSQPRPVLLHTIASHMVPSAAGDFTYGILSFLFIGNLSLDSIGRFIVGLILSATVFSSFMILVSSLAFWIGNASMIARQAMGAMITFAIYPTTLFEGTAKLILLTLIPAAFVGAIPAEFVRAFSWSGLFKLLGATSVLLAISLTVFHRGLKRYESGSAIQVQM